MCVGAALRVSDWKFLPNDGELGSFQKVPSSEKDALIPKSFYLAVHLPILQLLSIILQYQGSWVESRKLSPAFIYLKCFLPKAGKGQNSKS